MTLHNLLPLIALLLNVLLAGITLVRNPDSRLNRLFAYFVTGMAVWNFGVYMLRRSPDELNASFWEIIIHTAIVAIPASTDAYSGTCDSTMIRGSVISSMANRRPSRPKPESFDPPYGI